MGAAELPLRIKANLEAAEELDDDGNGVDPMALQMVSASLSRRLRQIKKGESHAVSAAVLLEPIREAGKDGDGGKAGDPASLKMGLIQLAAVTA